MEFHHDFKEFLKLLNSISGVQFNEAKANAVSVQFDDFTIPMISLEDLRKNTQASGCHTQEEGCQPIAGFEIRERVISQILTFVK